MRTTTPSGAPRATAELNDGAEPALYGFARVMREHLASPATRRSDGSRPRAVWPEGPRPVRSGTSPRRPRTSVTSVTSPTCLLADGTNSDPGHGDRLLQPPTGRLVAHHMRTSLVEEHAEGPGSTRAWWCLSQRPRGPTRPSTTPPVCRPRVSSHERRQRNRRVVQRDLKREVLQDATCWPDEATCRRQVFRWIIRYNTAQDPPTCRYRDPRASNSFTLLRSSEPRNPTPCPSSGVKA